MTVLTRNRPSQHGGYGLHWQDPDHRDYQFLPTVPAQSKPAEMVLKTFDSIPVLDQGQQGSCTGHGTAAAVMFDQLNEHEALNTPSRAMIYYNARRLEGTTDQDAGAQIRDAVKGIIQWGVCSDEEFPYSDQSYNVEPGAQCYADASKQRALVYEAVHYGHLQAAIASGYPFVYGMTVYESFESEKVAQTGIVPIPEAGEQVIGAHCVIAFGYNARFSGTATTGIPARHVKNRNSWGPEWGDHGNFYLPQWYYDSGQCSDFWVIRRIGLYNGAVAA